MTKPIEYHSGEVLNDKGAVFLYEIDKKNGRRQAVFLCGECHENTFIAYIEKVRHRGKFRCDECQRKHGYVRDSNGKPVVIDLTGQQFGDLKVLQYIGPICNGKHQLWLCECKCGRKCKVRGNNLKSGHTTSCGVCHTSLGEDKIENLLSEHGVNYVTQYSFEDCKRIKPLRFDFFLLDYNTCIEYDGRQHFGINGTWYEGHEDEYYGQKERDEIKTKYCETNGIPLYRISYLEYDNIDTRLEEILKEISNG